MEKQTRRGHRKKSCVKLRDYKSVPNADKGGEVKKSENFVDIINGNPLTASDSGDANLLLKQLQHAVIAIGSASVMHSLSRATHPETASFMPPSSE